MLRMVALRKRLKGATDGPGADDPEDSIATSTGCPIIHLRRSGLWFCAQLSGVFSSRTHSTGVALAACSRAGGRTTARLCSARGDAGGESEGPSDLSATDPGRFSRSLPSRSILSRTGSWPRPPPPPPRALQACAALNPSAIPATPQVMEPGQRSYVHKCTPRGSWPSNDLKKVIYHNTAINLNTVAYEV